MFMAFAWIPKATVQAAIGGLVLEKAREKPENAEYEQYGVKMLTTAVLSIIITAPLGAILTNSLGPKWLERLPSKDNMIAVSMDLKKVEKLDKNQGNEIVMVDDSEIMSNREDGVAVMTTQIATESNMNQEDSSKVQIRRSEDEEDEF
jgi:hypothetical protein